MNIVRHFICRVLELNPAQLKRVLLFGSYSCGIIAIYSLTRPVKDSIIMKAGGSLLALKIVLIPIAAFSAYLYHRVKSNAKTRFQRDMTIVWFSLAIVALMIITGYKAHKGMSEVDFDNLKNSQIELYTSYNGDRKEMMLTTITSIARVVTGVGFAVLLTTGVCRAIYKRCWSKVFTKNFVRGGLVLTGLLMLIMIGDYYSETKIEEAVSRSKAMALNPIITIVNMYIWLLHPAVIYKSLFFIVCEQWPSLLVVNLFGLYQQYIEPGDIKQLSRYILSIGNLGMIIGGLINRSINQVNHRMAIITAIELLSLLIFGLCYKHTTEIVATEKRFEFIPSKKEEKKAKVENSPRLSIGERVQQRYLMIKDPKNRFILNIATINLAYMIVNVISDVTFKYITKAYLDMTPSGSYVQFLSTIQIQTGILAVIAAPMLQKFSSAMSWETGSRLAVRTISFFTIGFLAMSAIYKIMLLGPDGSILSFISEWFPTRTVWMKYCVLFGQAGYVLTKAIKYIIIDPSKEMSYSAMTKEDMGVARAIAETFGGKVGKGMSSMATIATNSVYGKRASSQMSELPTYLSIHISNAMLLTLNAIPINIIICIAIFYIWNNSISSIAPRMKKHEENIAIQKNEKVVR